MQPLLAHSSWRRTGLAGLCGLLLVAGALLSRVDVPSGSAAVSTTLHAVVGPDFNISLSFDDGSAVTALPAGAYTVLVSDQSSEHNFHLYGPGVEQDSGIDATGSSTWRVTFQNNSTYIFQCDVHSADMIGRFTVGTVATTIASTTSGGGGGGTSTATTQTTTATTPSTLAGTLQATLSAAGKAALTLKGRPVTTLTQGSYKIVVSDKSSSKGFSLLRVGAAVPTSLTGVGFTGTHTQTVALKPGSWKFFSPPGKASAGVSFQVTSS
jgi:hypothetical protein